jgi:pSer/pThr/pTyr-binding forkhead associated (FHA) protein
VLDVPTVSARHARLEVVRRPDAKGGYSKLLLADLGSTNGTRVNRWAGQPAGVGFTVGGRVGVVGGGEV